MAPVATELDLATESTSEPPRPQPFADDAEDHQAILKAIVGNGYAHDESGRRLLRMHAAAIVEKIQATAKGDLLGQMQLAEAVKRRLSPANFEPDKDLYVALAIAESIRGKRDASSRARSCVSPTMTSRPGHACLS